MLVSVGASRCRARPRAQQAMFPLAELPMRNDRDVVVTGIGIVSSVGTGAGEFWAALQAGKPRFSPTSPSFARGEIPFVAKVMESQIQDTATLSRYPAVWNRTFRLLSKACHVACRDARLDRLDHLCCAVVTGIGDLYECRQEIVDAAMSTMPGVQCELWRRIADQLHPLSRLSYLPNIGGSLLSIDYQATGLGLTFVGDVTSGLQAVAEAYALIADGEADMAICGGADSPLVGAGLSLLRDTFELSKHPVSTLACRPFDRDCNGIVVGEGAGVLILEARESARTRGAAEYAQITAAASASGVKDAACAQVISEIINSARVVPDLIVAHGEGSERVDRREVSGIAKACGRLNNPTITSIKGLVGHTMSAAGPINAIAACLSLRHQFIPSISNLANPIAGCTFAAGVGAESKVGSALATVMSPSGAATAVLFAKA
jgi:3-oxoacyl-(acyl-carrier-protein) synthase